MDDFVDAEATIGCWDMVSRNLIGRTDGEGNRHGGLYPFLEPALGANSQDPENADTRFSAFADGRSQIGAQFGEAFSLLRHKAPGEAPGLLSRQVDALRPTGTKKYTSKRSNLACRGAPSTRHHQALQPTPPRRQAKGGFPKPHTEHCSLPRHDPGACNGGATAALPKPIRSSPGSI